MKGNFQRPGNVNEMAGSMEINLAVFAENAKHNPVGAKLFGGDDILLHRLEFVGAVAEVAAPRTNHYVEPN